MVLTGETREMQENATPAKEPIYERGRRNAAPFLLR
nr:MAG TPA: hypothetical protein [Caudoviricetes sp.]